MSRFIICCCCCCIIVETVVVRCCDCSLLLLTCSCLPRHLGSWLAISISQLNMVLLLNNISVIQNCISKNDGRRKTRASKNKLLQKKTTTIELCNYETANLPDSTIHCCYCCCYFWPKHHCLPVRISSDDSIHLLLALPVV